MCLSAVYKTGPSDQRELIADSVSTVRTDGSRITLTDILGQEITVEGSIKNVDLIGNSILIEN
jgi:predicted RNA-binding protein